MRVNWFVSRPQLRGSLRHRQSAVTACGTSPKSTVSTISSGVSTWPSAMPGWLPEKVSSRMRWTTSAPGTTRWSSSWTSSSWIAVEQRLVRGLVLLVVGVPAQVPARLVAALVRAAVGRLGQAEGPISPKTSVKRICMMRVKSTSRSRSGALGVDGRDAPSHGGGAERRLHGLAARGPPWSRRPGRSCPRRRRPPGRSRSSSVCGPPGGRGRRRPRRGRRAGRRGSSGPRCVPSRSRGSPRSTRAGTRPS